MEYARNCIASGEQFEDVIFTDETKIQLTSHVRFQCHKKGEPVYKQLRPVPKHPYQVTLKETISSLTCYLYMLYFNYIV